MTSEGRRYAPEDKSRRRLGQPDAPAGTRLQREFGISLVLSAPSVLYQVTLDGGEETAVDNPVYWPDPGRIEGFRPPTVRRQGIRVRWDSAIREGYRIPPFLRAALPQGR